MFAILSFSAVRASIAASLDAIPRVKEQSRPIKSFLILHAYSIDTGYYASLGSISRWEGKGTESLRWSMKIECSPSQPLTTYNINNINPK